MNKKKDNGHKDQANSSPASSGSPSQNRKKNLLHTVTTIFIYALIIFIVFMGRVIYSSFALYGHLKTVESAKAGKEFKGDRVLGYATANEFRTAKNEDVPYTRFEFNGTWPPTNEKLSRFHRPVIIALGCSFTYGVACKAKDAYPSVLGKKLNGTSLNTGLPSAGLGHLLFIARKLIPKYKPDYVLVQYSPWLAQRAANPFLRTPRGLIPAPYFTETRDGKLHANPPLYFSRFFEIPEKYRYTPRGIGDFLSFLVNFGIPVYTFEYYKLFAFKIKDAMGSKVKYSRDQRKITEFVYNEIAELCAHNNAKMIVVFIGDKDNMKLDGFPKEELDIIYAIKNISCVDTTAPLLKALKKPTLEEYKKTYCLHKTGDMVFYDEHPTESAHEIIAEVIFKTITGVKEP